MGDPPPPDADVVTTVAVLAEEEAVEVTPTADDPADALLEVGADAHPPSFLLAAAAAMRAAVHCKHWHWPPPPPSTNSACVRPHELLREQEQLVSVTSEQKKILVDSSSVENSAVSSELQFSSESRRGRHLLVYDGLLCWFDLPTIDGAKGWLREKSGGADP